MNDSSWNSTYVTTLNINGSGQQLDGDSSPSGSRQDSNAIIPFVTTTFQRNLALYGYIFLFIFGFFGHLNSIIIFSRRTLRSMSTICIYDFLYTGVGLTPINPDIYPNLSDELCRFRSFIQSVTMCLSSWLLLGIAIDRWLRVRFPFQVKKLCTRNHALLSVLIMLILDTIFNSHLLLPSFATLSGSNLCGPLSPTTYSFFFRKIWVILFPFLQTFLPKIILIIATIDIFYRLRLQQKRKLNGRNRRHAFLDRQILIIMLTSIFLFFATQIPLSLFNILLSPVLKAQLSITQALEITSICTFIASINFATTFYVHCLTSKLFRNEFYYIKSCYRRIRVGMITRILDGNATQTQTLDIPMKRRGNQQDCSIETVD